MNARRDAARAGLRLLAAALAFGSAATAGVAVAQPASDDMRDGMGDRLRACAACHGDAGRSGDEAYYPSIAGKPSGYLFAQLANFRDGRRHNAIMQPMLAYLSDAYLREIADWYAAQPPAIAPHQTAAAPAVLELGRSLVEHGDPARELPACRDCHGAELIGVAPAIPGLLGLRSDYLSAQMGAWRSGVRAAAQPDCMARVAAKLSGAEISAVTAWISSRPYPEPPAQPAADASAAPRTLPIPCGGVP